ncbi:response regulator [Candidatus Lokiarchaeum ossiferum]|uniref:response regulator n=1 Tax=Candidatus Lokiarchaeum ossiferum TaxID=2951803 RepID=UPI00352BE6FD
MNQKILIVEDEPIPAEDVKEILEAEGYTIIGIVNNGLDAIDVASKQKPDMVLMDINLQGNMTGTEAAVVIQSYFKIPIIFLTAYADKTTLEEAKKANPYGYIIKPYEENEILTTIDIVFNKRQMEQEKEKSFLQEINSVKKELEKAHLNSKSKTQNQENSEENVISSLPTTPDIQENENFLMEMLEEFSNTDRFLILDCLRLKAHSILELEIILQKAQPTLYHHIRRLEQKGLIKGKKNGKITYYSLMEHNFQTFLTSWKAWTQKFTAWFGVE